jgi:hypothetical protein
MVLHTVKELNKSIEIIFSKAKTSGKVFVIDFNDSAEKMFRGGAFVDIEEDDNKHIKGTVELPSGMRVKSEIIFHKEKEIEKEIIKYGKFKKKNIGPIFVAYECVKI